LLRQREIGFPTRFDTMHFGRYAQITDKITGSYFQTFLYDGELVKTTHAAADAGLAVREPYLDLELVAYMARIDERLKLKGGVRKYLLKEIAHSYIPRKLLARPKQGFTIPSSAWMRGPLREMVHETLSEAALKRDGVLDPAVVRKLREDFFRGREIYKYKLWSIFLYQLWYRHNFDREQRSP
jgi:asparagine synthase (glutamine-hydrolysing)